MNSPKQATWIIAVVLASIAIIQEYFFDLNLGQYAFYMMIASVVLLAVGSRMKGI